VGEVNVELRRSGFADWQLEYAFDHWIGIVVVLPLALLSNLLTHLFVFRCGWTLHVSAGDYYYKKVRYRSKAAAQADIGLLLQESALPLEGRRPGRHRTTAGVGRGDRTAGSRRADATAHTRWIPAPTLV